MYSLSASLPASLRWTGTNCSARVALVGDEEQARVEPAQPVRAVDEVVAAAQQPGAVVRVGWASRTCASSAISGSPSRLAR